MRVVEVPVASLTCPACAEPIEADFAACPRCDATFASTCAGCRGPLKPAWARCPYCRLGVSGGVTAKAA